LAAAHGLRACWSTPIEGRTRPILGTFAIYYRTPRSPTADELEAIRHIVHTAAEAIEGPRA
jgi:GAF domain-containing protein